MADKPNYDAFVQPILNMAARQRVMLDAWGAAIARVKRGESKLCWDPESGELVEVTLTEDA